MNNYEINIERQEYDITVESQPEYIVELPSQGPVGPQGERGPIGPQGEQGPKGEDGEAGPANTLTIGTVEKGEEAEATITGESPNQVLNLVLPKGDKGDKGEQGEQGPQGPQGIQGLSATINVGTVTTLPAGSQATVVNVGTESSAIFNFGIPKGKDGEGGGGGASSFSELEGSPYDNANLATALNSKASTDDITLKGVQLNGTDLTIDENKKVAIPIATTTNKLGLVQTGGTGVGVTASGLMYTTEVSDSQLQQKTNQYNVVTSRKVDMAVKVGLTTNTLTLSDTEQQTARTWLNTTLVTIEDLD